MDVVHGGWCRQLELVGQSKWPDWAGQEYKLTCWQLKGAGGRRDQSAALLTLGVSGE